MIIKFADHVAELLKQAHEEKKKTSPYITIARNAAAVGLGTIGGYGFGKALEAITRRQNKSIGNALPIIAGTAGLALGAAYPLWQAYERKETERNQPPDTIVRTPETQPIGWGG